MTDATRDEGKTPAEHVDVIRDYVDYLHNIITEAASLTENIKTGDALKESETFLKHLEEFEWTLTELSARLAAFRKKVTGAGEG